MTFTSKHPRELLPLSTDGRIALSRLVTAGRLIRRHDGYGNATSVIISLESARELKRRGFATPGFNDDMFATAIGKTLNAEGGSDAAG